MGCISGMQTHLYGGDVSDAEASVHPFHASYFGVCPFSCWVELARLWGLKTKLAGDNSELGL